MDKLWKRFKRIKKNTLQVMVVALAIFSVVLLGICIATNTTRISERAEIKRLGILLEEKDSMEASLMTALAKRTAALRQCRNLATTHLVVEGDCLWKIAKWKLGDAKRWPEIWLLNKDIIENPDLIYPGQLLRIRDLDKDLPVE